MTLFEICSPVEVVEAHGIHGVMYRSDSLGFARPFLLQVFLESSHLAAWQPSMQSWSFSPHVELMVEWKDFRNVELAVFRRHLPPSTSLNRSMCIAGCMPLNIYRFI